MSTSINLVIHLGKNCYANFSKLKRILVKFNKNWNANSFMIKIFIRRNNLTRDDDVFLQGQLILKGFRTHSRRK